MFSWRRLTNSFKFAFRGLFSAIQSEQNFRIHVLLAAVAIFLGFYFSIPAWQWCLVVVLVAAIFILELLNTIFERLVDVFKPRMHEYIGEIKDMMSATVLVAALASIVIGLLIFIPYII